MSHEATVRSVMRLEGHVLVSSTTDPLDPAGGRRKTHQAQKRDHQSLEGPRSLDRSRGKGVQTHPGGVGPLGGPLALVPTFGGSVTHRYG